MDESDLTEAMKATKMEAGGNNVAYPTVFLP
jgi:hypothetical protein